MSSKKLPFTEELIAGLWLKRTFDQKDCAEFKWHTDAEDRIFCIFDKTDWQIQYDNQSPFIPIPNEMYFIPKGVYHRVIAGTGSATFFVRKVGTARVGVE